MHTFLRHDGQPVLVAARRDTGRLVPVAASTMLVTAAYQCVNPRGSYFLTKALQTKIQLSRHHGWKLWVAGEEGKAAAQYATLESATPASTITAEDEATFGAAGEAPALLLQAQRVFATTSPHGEGVGWLLWVASDVFIQRPSADLPWKRLVCNDTCHFLLSAGKTGVDVSVLLIRVI